MGFLRRTWNRYSKLGKKRKKKQVWKRPTGRDNKMREKRRGYPAVVSIGYKKDKKSRKKILVIRNSKDLDSIKKDCIVVIGNVGKKKKIEILQKAKGKKIKFQNINAEKFLKKNVKIKKEKVEEKKPEKNADEDTSRVKKNETK
jgi:large subunit ribosomal protein L32e